MDEPKQSNAGERLEAWARHRREGPEARLDGATRARLQAEVARVYPARPARFSWAALWGSWWFRLGAIPISVLAIGVFILTSQNQQTRQMAQLGQVAESRRPDEAQPAPTTEERMLRDAPEQPVAVALNLASASAPAPEPPATASSRQQAATKDATATKTAAARVPAAQPPAERKELALARPPARAMKVEADAAGAAAPALGLVSATTSTPLESIRRRFQSTTPAAGQRRSAVLSNFELEMTGTQVRLIDADGSIYTGNFTQPTAASAVVPVTASAARREAQPSSEVVQKADLAAPPGSSIQSLRFTGTNRTLGRTVSFDGRYIVPPPPAADAPPGPATNRARVTMTGTATIDGKQTIQIRATSPDP